MRRVKFFIISFKVILLMLVVPLTGYCQVSDKEPIYVYKQALLIMKQAGKDRSTNKYKEAKAAFEDIKREFPDWDCFDMVDLQIDMCNKEIEKSRIRKIEDVLVQEMGQVEERRIVRESSPALEQEVTWLELARKEAKRRRQEAGRIARQQAKAEVKPFRVSGKASLRYENDWGNEADDQKLSEYLLLKMDDIVSNHISAYLHMRGEQDLDGGGGNVYSSTRDRIYSAYIDLEKLPLKLALRGGRQYFPEVESIHFDGLRVNWSDNRKGSFSLFSGKPVTYYGTRYADLLSGGVVTLTPSRFRRLTAYYLNLKNDSTSDSGEGISFYQRFGRAFNIIGRSAFLNEELKDLSVIVRYNHFPSRVSVNTSYYRQMLEIDTASGEYSPYVLSLGSFIPFHHISLNLNRAFGDSLQLGAGFLLRRPLDSTNEAQKNMKFNKYFGSLNYSNFLWKGLNPSITFNHWDNPSSNRNSLSGILTQKCGERFEISLGTFFSNYYYSFYTREERTETRTYFFKLDYDIMKNLDISFDLSRQDSSNFAEPSYSSEVRVNRRF